MLSYSDLGPGVLQMTVSEPVSPADIGPAFERVEAVLKDHPKLSILADVVGSPTIWPNVVLEEMKHLPTIFRLMRALEKIAVVADADWIRTAAKIESKLIPGVEYQVFTREEAAQARAWIMGEAPPPPAQ